MTDRNLIWSKTLLLASATLSGEADNVSITNSVADPIRWGRDWYNLHIQISNYRDHLAEAGHIEKTRPPDARSTRPRLDDKNWYEYDSNTIPLLHIGHIPAKTLLLTAPPERTAEGLSNGRK